MSSAHQHRRPPKPITWMGDSRHAVQQFPDDVRHDLGTALFYAQQGAKHPDAKALTGFGDAGVLEIIENYAGDTYRVVYTVRFADRIYVLHAFQKKSKRRRQTPRRELDLINSRLKQAERRDAEIIKEAKR